MRAYNYVFTVDLDVNKIECVSGGILAKNEIEAYELARRIARYEYPVHTISNLSVFLIPDELIIISYETIIKELEQAKN